MYFDHFAKSRSTVIGELLSKHKFRQVFRFIEGHLPDNRELEILEIGPGQGELCSLFMKNNYANYDVVEPNEHMAKKLNKLRIRQLKNYIIPRLKEKSSSYDLIIVSDVFEHLNDAEDTKLFVSEARRVLKRNGKLFIMSPDLMDWKEDFYNCDFSHSNPTTVRRTSQLFFNAGLKTLKYHYIYSCFPGTFGLVLSKIVKTLTFFSKGENINSKIYKLRLNFSRRFMIICEK